MQTAALRVFCHWSQSNSTAMIRQCLKCRALTLQQSSRAYGVIPPPRDSEEKEMVHRMLRVDHAGEYGANRIYAGQMAVLGRSKTGPFIQEMWDQEKKHLEKFNEILAENRVRPTALLPFWNIAGFVLGASSALLGKEGAMACTVAVEESITEHYNNQIRTLMEKDPERYTELLQPATVKPLAQPRSLPGSLLTFSVKSICDKGI
uniref:Coenzyme Q7 homolog, ubiquinone (yeast) n=1 Tax=Oreochromis niloticus TaxID=8128 RepID=A0A669DBX7_ORENI